MSKEIFKEGKVFIQSDVENKQLKEESEKLRNEENEKLRKEESEKLKKEENEKLRKENEQLRKENERFRQTKKSIEKPIEIKIPKENENTTDFYPNLFDKNKFKNILAIIDKNTFNYRHKRGEFKYVDIADLVINIKNNKISEIFTTKILNTLNEIKNAEIIKLKKRTPRQKELLNLLNNLSDTILTDKTLESKS